MENAVLEQTLCVADGAPQGNEMEQGSSVEYRGSCDPASEGHDPLENINPAESRQAPGPALPAPPIIESFDELYQRYARRVYLQCLHMVRNPEDAEDLTQEVFLSLFRKAHTFRGESSFGTWLHRITVNTVLMQFRRLRRWRETVTSSDRVWGQGQEEGDRMPLVSSIADRRANTLQKVCVNAAIGQLPSGYRQVFLLHDAEGYLHDEISKRLRISSGTSKSQLHKARCKLRKLLQNPATSSRAVWGSAQT